MKSKILLSIIPFIISATALAADHVVEMKNIGTDGSTMIFEPGYIKVAVGDTVTFKATDPAHNSQTSPDLIPTGAESWIGPIGKDLTVTIEKEGVYVYKCMPHTVMAMVGVIQAGKPTNLEAIKTASKSLSASFVMNKDRLDKYLALVK